MATYQYGQFLGHYDHLHKRDDKRFRIKRWSNLHEFSHLSSAFSTNDGGFRIENGSPSLVLLNIVKNFHNSVVYTLDRKFRVL